MKYFVCFFFFLLLVSCKAQKYTVTLKVDMSNVENVKSVGIKGNVKPLSEKKELLLTDNNADGIYETTITFKTSQKRLRFKFVKNGEEELIRGNDRTLWFNIPEMNEQYIFNEYPFFDKDQLAKLVYTKDQISEDISVLKEILEYVHPNIYRYRDSAFLQEDFKLLENEILSEPTMVNSFKQISKFLTKIKCGHTFTNLWNQGINIQMAVLNQPNKLPLTFNRLNERMFIDKNASTSELLQPGLEILSINGVSATEIMSRLTQYITSDGNNYQKQLERLVIDGTEKYALFDIFYPLEFGDTSSYDFQLKDYKKEEIFNVTVPAISKTNRDYILNDRYEGLETSFEDGWEFKMIEENVGLLKIKSFAYATSAPDFDWEGYIDVMFKELNEKKVANLIIDIRGNEGGQDVIGKYILEHLIQEPLTVKGVEASVRYLKIPDHFRNYISTWDNVPYNFTRRVKKESNNGRYFLKDKFSLPGQTFRPKKNGYKGKSYLITDAQNSSATHLMATYAKKINSIQIVGEETGGSQRGINAGSIFFLRLPHTKVEVDIGVISLVIPQDDESIGPDGGIKPDIPIQKAVEDITDGKDRVLNEILDLINKS